MMEPPPPVELTISDGWEVWEKGHQLSLAAGFVDCLGCIVIVGKRCRDAGCR